MTSYEYNRLRHLKNKGLIPKQELLTLEEAIYKTFYDSNGKENKFDNDGRYIQEDC